VVHLEGYGLIRVFKIVSRDGDIEYWATNDLAMDELTRLRLAERAGRSRTITGAEAVLRGGAGAGPAARAQRNHIGLAIRAFLRLEHHFFSHRGQLVRAKARIIRVRSGVHREASVRIATNRVTPMLIQDASRNRLDPIPICGVGPG
jgi:hypothetical protein